MSVDTPTACFNSVIALPNKLYILPSTLFLVGSKNLGVETGSGAGYKTGLFTFE